MLQLKVYIDYSVKQHVFGAKINIVSVSRADVFFLYQQLGLLN